MADIDLMISHVWTSDVRVLVEEAWRCYNAGAFRACISTTWTAVAADIISKLVYLAEEGDAEAATFRAVLDKAQAEGLGAGGVRVMQQIEDSLLQRSESFELIDSIARRELERLREDRNLCVHPSLRSSSVMYVAQSELARSHLAIALSNILIHPPTQGRRMLDQFKVYICDPSFVPTPAHIQATFFDRVRVAARRNIAKFAAKHALLELAADASLTPAEHADRMALALDSFAARDRALVEESINGSSDLIGLRASDLRRRVG